jgi:hypothetical protein
MVKEEAISGIVVKSMIRALCSPADYALSCSHANIKYN